MRAFPAWRKGKGRRVSCGLSGLGLAGEQALFGQFVAHVQVFLHRFFQSGRTARAGEPMTSMPSGMSAVPVTSAPAPTRQCLPTRAPSMTTAPMPTSEPSPMVQPCTMAPCPTVTLLPMTD